VQLAHKLTSTRAGTLTLAAVAAATAGALILVYLHNYRRTINVQGAPVTVLVAKGTIAKGTPGEAIASSGLFTTTTIRASQLSNGAISDPGVLRGRVAAHDILAGQQLTASDFVSGGNSLAASLTKTERAITIPIDSAHGLIGTVQPGDHVDVLAGFNVIPLGPNDVPIGNGQARPVLRVIMQNVPVVGVDSKASGVGGTASTTSKVTVEATEQQAANLAFASDNGKVWLVLRPASGAKLAPPTLVTMETLLLGVRPITVLHSFGGR